MKKYSEEELKRLKRQIIHKTGEMKKEDVVISENKAKIKEMEDLGADKELYANETRNIEGAEARKDRWKELLTVDFKECIEMFDSRIEELNGKAKEMSSYLSKTPTARQIDASLKEEENLKLDEQIKEIEAKKQKKLNLMLNYQNMGDDDRAEELRKDVEGFDQEISGINNKKQENIKIIELNNAKQEEVKDILKEIAGIKKEINSAKELAKQYGIELDAKEEVKTVETTDDKKVGEAKAEESKPADDKKVGEAKAEESKPADDKKVGEIKPADDRIDFEDIDIDIDEINKKVEELKKSRGTTKAEKIKVEEIIISPESMTIYYKNDVGEVASKKITLDEMKEFEDKNEENIKTILEERNIEYDKVDPRIVQALYRNESQFNAYLEVCQLDENRSDYEERLEEAASEVPMIEYELRDIRKADMDIEDKTFIYDKAKETKKLFKDLEDCKCTVDIGLLDRARFALHRIGTFLSKVFANKVFKPNKEKKLLKDVNEKLEKEYKTPHQKFTDELQNMKAESVKEVNLDEAEQLKKLAEEAERLTLSDGDVMPKKEDEGEEIEF